MSNDAPIDLVCWDFGDTLVDELFMRLPPLSFDGWPDAYEEMVAANGELFRRLDLGQATLNDLIEPLSDLVPLPRAEIAKHLRVVWRQIEWFPASGRWVERLADARVLQAVVTVNPHEFHGMAVACGLDELVDVIVTSAEIADVAKPPMAERARALLGLEPGLGSTLLIDNKAHNTTDFDAAGGRSILYEPATFEAEAARVLSPLVA